MKMTESARGGVMAFSGEDLKRLQEDAVSRFSCSCTICHLMYEPMLRQMPALLARLGAAEAMENYWLSYIPVNKEDEEMLDAADKKWRKAAGKDL